MAGIPTNIPSDAVSPLLEVLDRLEIPYEIGGSVASSAHGIPRTTLDVDIVVDMKPEQIEPFAAELSGEFYADAALIREAFTRGRAANLIHYATAWKFDLFPLRDDEYSRTEFGGGRIGKFVPTVPARSSARWRPRGGYGSAKTRVVSRRRRDFRTAME
jgi:hypothetical protein